MELPHPPISLPVFLVVENALRVAWAILRKRNCPHFDLDPATEDPITHELYEILYDELFAKGRVPGFDRELLTVVTREPKLRTYDRRSLDKMPDLLVGLAGRTSIAKPSQDWLFIECKPVDMDHTVGKHYCGKGVIRFVEGEYAWTMTSAMMIGYARKGYTIPSKLGKALKDRPATMHTLNFPEPCPHSAGGVFSEAVHVSKHDRKFRYRETRKKAPPITIRHLWLSRD
ncbi:hypothetical protein HQ560_15440 [bacterium]|nr:hypothetical protein [bacterium]